MSPKSKVPILKLLVTLSITFAVALLVNIAVYTDEKQDLTSSEGLAIKSILIENFDQVEKVLVFTGRKIAKEAPDLNPYEIHKIFVQMSQLYGNDSMFSWSMFDWVNNKNQQTINTMFGVRTKNFPDMSDRYYTLKGSDLWTLLFSKPVIGTPSKTLVIPVGVQIETDQVKRAGTIAVGINIKKLSNQIEARLDRNTRFAIIDNRDSKLVFGSQNYEIFIGSSFNALSNSIGSDYYVSEENMGSKYPYKVWVGYDKSQFWQKVFRSTILLTFQIVGIAVIVSYLRYKS